jgi:hypothetical protein
MQDGSKWAALEKRKIAPAILAFATAAACFVQPGATIWQLALGVNEKTANL